jgi:hypothetical protein
MFSPKVNRNDVKIVSSDAFLDARFVKTFFPNANFIRDRYHLVEAAKRRVGIASWSTYEQTFHCLLSSINESDFNSNLQQLLNLANDEKLKSYFRDLGNDRGTFADYMLKSYEGNLGLKGSSMSEQNNSSLLSFVDSLHSSRTLDELLLVLIRRQKMKERKSNNTLLKQSMLLNHEVRGATEGWRKEAATKLAYYSYVRFCGTVQQSANYTVERDDLGYKVTRKHSEAPARFFQNETMRCTCESRVSYMAPCAHEIAIRSFRRVPLFDISSFHIRHHLRLGLSLSFDAGKIIDDEDSQYHSDNDDLKQNCNDDLTGESINTEGNDDNSGLHSENDDNDIEDMENEHKESTKRKKITFAMLQEAYTEHSNELMRWNEETRAVFLGLITRSLQMLKNPKECSAKWYAREIQQYVNSYLNSCKTEFKRRGKVYNCKRFLSMTEKIGKKRKTDSDFSQSLSQKNEKSEKKCSRCGEAFATGHHTKNNCPLNEVNKK